MTSNVELERISFDLVSEDEVEAAHEIEVASYPPDEAASLEAFKSRQSQASELFLGAFLPSTTTTRASSNANPGTPPTTRTLIGYICSTASPSPSLTHASMSSHDPAGSSVCIHSVCVSPSHRRRGVASALLKEYTARLRDATRPDGSARYARILLIVHEELRGLYEKAGFEWVGRSEVVHGAHPWFEMRKDLRPVPHELGSDVISSELHQPREPPTSAMPNLLELLQASRASSSSRRARPVPRLLSTFASIDEVASSDTSEEGQKLNRYDLLCPQEHCGCVLLRAGVGILSRKEPVELEPIGHDTALPVLPPLPSGEEIQCWLVQPNPMVFENIGFSRPVPQSDLQQGALETGPRKKFLICADCDLGPLGWTFDGVNEFWLVCNRVGYKQ